MINTLVNWWHGYPEEGLDFYYQRTKPVRYSCTVEVIAKLKSLKWHLQQRANNVEHHLVIGGVYKKKMLPIIDADTERDMLNASLWLGENKVDHTILASSSKGFWIIIDRPGRWRDIRNWINIPGQDGNYRSFSMNLKMCYLRAEMKEEYFVPTIIEESGSELVDGFAREVVGHFSSKMVRWLWRMESYRNDKVNLTNPDEFEVGLTLDEVFA